MGEMVASAVVQEVVSGGFSYMRNSQEESASQSHLMERLKMAYLELKFALERTMKMPITEVSLLQRRMELKHAFQECRGVLNKHTAPQINLDDEGAEQRVTLWPSFPKRIMHAVKPFFSTGMSVMSGSCVRRFEWYAEKADKFVRDVESGFSLARYRFSSPLITQLLEGKWMYYRMESRSQTHTLRMIPSFLEDYGVVAVGIFRFEDLKAPMKCFRLALMLRLSESTDIVGIWTKCLQSLDPQFKPVADFASGELAQMSTQVGFYRPAPVVQERWFNEMTGFSTTCRPEPLCCIGDGFQPSAKNTLSSELTKRFPEQISYLRFDCFISAAEYNLQSSSVETKRNTIKDWPILQLSVQHIPHFSLTPIVGTYLGTPRGGLCGPIDDCFKLEPEPRGRHISETAMFVPFLAVDCFKLEPERTEYVIYRCSPHGLAVFTVNKPTTEEMGYGPKVGGESKTRRVSKRKR